jgi:glycosyltransferase involved in cell wall biosynthesis
MEATVTPKVSIITPVYNGEAYIASAIESLLSQVFTDWELIVVDDGSSDSTLQILQRFTDNRIKVIHQENSGEAGARNTGLENACAEYIAFLDADDFYFPNALTDLSSYLDQHPEFGVVYSNGQICDSENKPLMTLSEIRPGLYTGNILEQVVLSSSVVTVPVCTMTRRSEINDHSVRFDRNLVIGPDWDFWIQLAVYTGFGYLDKLTCKYRIHPSNITRTSGSEKRRRDTIYRRMKILNSAWFATLSLNTKILFFLDLLTSALSGDSERQNLVLQSEQFSELPASCRADLWRMVGIDMLQNSHDSEQAKSCFLKSRDLDPHERKTQFLLWSLGFGKEPALAFINLWRKLLKFGHRVTNGNNSHQAQLQNLLGIE